MVGGASWSADESVLAFVADAAAPEAEPFANRFEFREELGEKRARRAGRFSGESAATPRPRDVPSAVETHHGAAAAARRS